MQVMSAKINKASFIKNASSEFRKEPKKTYTGTPKHEKNAAMTIHGKALLGLPFFQLATHNEQNRIVNANTTLQEDKKKSYNE
jgi:hypothetical protein